MSELMKSIIVQFGFAGFFALGILGVTLKFYEHYENEIKYLRGKIDTLETEIKELIRGQLSVKP